MLVSDVLWALVGGTAVGVAGAALSPGRHDDFPLWLTILAGIGGVVLGNVVYVNIWSPTTPGVDWVRHGWQLAVAAVTVAAAVTAVEVHRRGRRH